MQNNRKLIKYRCDYLSTPLKVLQARGWIRVHNHKDMWKLWWCDTNELRLALDGALHLQPQQRISHFLNHSELTRKNLLYRNLKRYKRLLMKAEKIHEAQLCDAMPVTFELPNEYRMLVEEHRRGLSSTWIVKPTAGSQGRGIFLFQRLKDLSEWRAKECLANKNNFSDYDTLHNLNQSSYVVQKYIDDPYLLEGRKFDLRIYVLVTSFQPLIVWLAREGFARLSGKQFSLDKIDDSLVHLTNTAIQLKEVARTKILSRSLYRNKDLNYSVENEDNDKANLQFQPGRKWPLCSLRQYLIARHGTVAVEQLFQNIAGIVIASLQAVQSTMISNRNSFELYGYDVIIDERLKPWLLEVNASPSLNATDAADFRLKFDLIDDVLNILDFEKLLTGSEIRVGGFDLLWNDEPVWTSSTYISCYQEPRRLNIFLGEENNRMEQLQSLNIY